MLKITWKMDADPDYKFQFTHMIEPGLKDRGE